MPEVTRFLVGGPNPDMIGMIEMIGKELLIQTQQLLSLQRPLTQK